jgi:hypothetical protein
MWLLPMEAHVAPRRHSLSTGGDVSPRCAEVESRYPAVLNRQGSHAHWGMNFARTIAQLSGYCGGSRPATAQTIIGSSSEATTRNWRYCMPGSPKRIDADAAGKSHRATYQVMYLAKRPSYEFVLAIPEDHPRPLNADRVLVQMRFKDQHQAQDFVLDLNTLEDFYESLSQLVDYLKAERERRGRKL